MYAEEKKMAPCGCKCHETDDLSYDVVELRNMRDINDEEDGDDDTDA